MLDGQENAVSAVGLIIGLLGVAPGTNVVTIAVAVVVDLDASEPLAKGAPAPVDCPCPCSELEETGPVSPLVPGLTGTEDDELLWGTCVPTTAPMIVAKMTAAATTRMMMPLLVR